MAEAESFMRDAGGTTVRGSAQGIERDEAAYERQNTSFRIRNRDFSSQYFDLYRARIAALRAAVVRRAQELWLGKELHIGGALQRPRLLEHVLDLEVGYAAIVVGTVYKHHPLLPTVLEVYAKQRAIIAPPPLESYVSDDDIIGIEDEGGRVKLVQADALPADLGSDPWGAQRLQRDRLLHGQVVAVLGTVQASGVMAAYAYCTAGPPPQPQLPRPLSGAGLLEGAGRYVAFVSGLQGAEELQQELMLDFLGGHSGSSLEQEQLQQKIVRVVIAGNCIPRIRKAETDDDMAFQRRRGDLGATEEQLEQAALIKHVDLVLANLSASVPVDLMPGPMDPANYSLPQQPLNHCLFPVANRYASFHRVTNPHHCKVGDALMLGTSGQEIASMRKFVTVDSSLEIMKSLLASRHIAPTAPDTLAAYPCQGVDPFVLEQCPHVYFIGNQDSYETDMFQGPDGQRTRLISVPSFAKTASIVLLDVDSLACHEVTFKVAL